MASATTTPSPQTTQSHIDTCTSNANPTWRAAALAAITRLASRCERLTSFDVLEEVEKSGAKTHDLRAVGGIMQEARDLGLIESIGLVRRNDKHSRGATTLWHSRLYPTQAAHPNSQPNGETQQP
jgi:hypothetical protein